MAKQWYTVKGASEECYCSRCQEPILTGDKALMDSETQKVFCTASCWGQDRDDKPLPYIVTLVIDDVVLETGHAFQTMARTLRLAAEKLKGVPSAEVCIRRQGVLVAYLKSSWKGELEGAEVYASRVSRGDSSYRMIVRVIPLNPNGPIFAGVFAS